MSRGFDPLTPGVLPGRSRAEQVPLADTAQQGTAVAVSAAGVTVELDRMPDVGIGPAPWSLGSYATATAALTAGYAPHVGDSVVVVFAGQGLAHPVVLAWWR